MIELTEKQISEIADLIKVAMNDPYNTKGWLFDDDPEQQELKLMVWNSLGKAKGEMFETTMDDIQEMKRSYLINKTLTQGGLMK